MKPRFNYAKMRNTFYAWHGGQYSPLYAAASSGLVDDIDALQCELRKNAQWCTDNPRTQVDCASDSRYLCRVANALPLILSDPFVHSFDGRTYRALPWANGE